ncbi:hypothetical protein MBCUT_04550 [Methanobrevibacter cuticularis]|uniref:Uncharacterized protein n=1 Tax=Methanobrevibacter cuticularis TaxID=47311 RepID=A0A166EQN0_9EURY|nr:hypothetical protein [Methanobrevibacter cuticularis]KZX16904.1 hypothetical protein MBCUT_04550 [Methanobrevibacter cuticularis]
MNSILEIEDPKIVGSNNVPMPVIHILKDCIYDTRMKYEYKEKQPYTLVLNLKRKDYDLLMPYVGKDVIIYKYGNKEEFDKGTENKEYETKMLKKQHIKLKNT